MQRTLFFCACLVILLASPLALAATTAPASGAVPEVSAAAAAAPSFSPPGEASLLFTPTPIAAACTATNCSQAAVYANGLCHVGIRGCLDQFSCNPAHPCSFTYSCQPC